MRETTVSESHRQKINSDLSNFPCVTTLGHNLCLTLQDYYSHMGLVKFIISSKSYVKGWFQQYKKKATVKQPRFWLRPVHPSKAELRKDKIVKMCG